MIPIHDMYITEREIANERGIESCIEMRSWISIGYMYMYMDMYTCIARIWMGMKEYLDEKERENK